MTTQRAANHVHSDRWQCRVGPCSTNCDLIRRPATPQLGFAPGWRAGAFPEPPRGCNRPGHFPKLLRHTSSSEATGVGPTAVFLIETSDAKSRWSEPMSPVSQADGHDK